MTKARRSKKPSIDVRVRLREFSVPPVHDTLVLGKRSPIGRAAMGEAIKLLHVASFVAIELDDDIVGDILVRASVLNKIPRDQFVQLVVDRVKPFMTAEEILHLDVEADVFMEVKL